MGQGNTVLFFCVRAIFSVQNIESVAEKREAQSPVCTLQALHFAFFTCMVSAMKLGPVGKAVVVVAVAVCALIAIRALDAVPASRLASFLGITVTVSDLSPTVSPSLTPRPTGYLSELSRGTVAVQTFRAASLVATGSGTVVSSDGLILTTSLAAPYGSGSYVYQVATTDGEVLRAVGVWRVSGFVLLKVQATDLDAVLFEAETPKSGDQVTVVGAFLSLSQYVPVIVPAVIPYAAESRNTVISIDRALLPSLYGARVVDGSGRSIGLIQPTYPLARLLSAADINAALEKYFASAQKR